MADGKPWEKYQQATEAEAGPWTKYQNPAPAPSEDKWGLGPYGNPTIKTFSHAADVLDSYTGAPGRKFMGSLQDDAAKGDESFGAVWRALKAGYHQFGKPTDTAPSAIDIINKDRGLFGLTNNKTLQDVTGKVFAYGTPMGLISQGLLGREKTEGLLGKTPKAAAALLAMGALDWSTHGLGQLGNIQKAGGLLKKTAPVQKLGEVAENAKNFIRESAEGALRSEAGKISLGSPEVPIISDAQVDTIRQGVGNKPNPMQSYADLERYTRAAEESGAVTTLPKIDDIREAQSRVKDLKHPLWTAQERASTNPNDSLAFGTLRKSGTKTSEQIAKLEQLQKRELETKIDEVINSIHPEGKVSLDPTESASQLQSDFLKQYSKNQKQLGKTFSKYDSITTEPIEHNSFLTDKIAKEIPEIASFIEVSDEGAKLKPYNLAMGISKDEYNTVGQVVDTLNSQPLTVKEIRNIRGGLLRMYPDPASRPPIVQGLRKAMLEHIKDIVGKNNPAERAAIHQTFKNYATNEQNLSELEKVFGGSFSEYSRPGKTPVPEKVLNNIFANSRNANVAKTALGEEVFNRALADYLSLNKQKFMTKDGALSAERFGTWLKNKESVLWDVANPNDILRLTDLNTLHRAVDLPPVNPSGTAAANVSFKDVLSPKQALGRIKDEYLKNRAAKMTFEDLNNTPKGLLGQTRGLLNKTTKNITDKTIGEEYGALLRKFLKDEEGAFTPDQVKGFLKKEGTYDLKKARETAGPAKGLLPGEGNNPVAKYRAPLSKEERADLLNWIDSAYTTLRRGERFSPVDEKYLREVLPVAPDYQKKYVKDLLEQIEKQKNPTSDLEELKQLTTTSESTKPAVEAAKNFKPGQVITSEDGKKWTVLDNTNKGGLIMLRDEAGNTTHDYADSLWQYAKRQLQPDEPRGLLTNLNVERGPVKEGIQPSKPAPLILENGRPPELKPDTIIDLPNGKQVITRGEYSYFEPGKGRVYWVEPSSAAGFESGTSGKMYQISEKEMLGDKYADYFAGKQAELDAARNEWKLKSGSDETTRESREAARKAAEAKKVVSVDVPKRVNNAARADFEKIQKLREKVNNGKQITDSEFEYLKGMLGEYDGALHDEAMHVIEGDWRLMGKSKPKSKPTTVDVPFGGSVTLNKATSNAVEVSPKKYHVLEALDDDSGYLVIDPDTQKTMEVSHGEISGVFNENGRRVTKPKDVDLKYKIGQEVMYDGRPVKVVQYDGNGVYTIKKGNMHDQVHMSDLKPKGKPTKPKGKK